MGQFNVGDKVRIKPLSDDMPFSTNSEMDSLEGEVFTIENVIEGEYNKIRHSKYLCDECRYVLSGEASKWSWSNPMLVLVKKADEVKAELTTLSDISPDVFTKVDATRTKDETPFIDEVQKSLERIASVCGIPKSILPKENVEPLKLAVKKHSVKLNFKN